MREPDWPIPSISDGHERRVRLRTGKQRDGVERRGDGHPRGDTCPPDEGKEWDPTEGMSLSGGATSFVPKLLLAFKPWADFYL